MSFHFIGNIKHCKMRKFVAFYGKICSFLNQAILVLVCNLMTWYNRQTNVEVEYFAYSICAIIMTVSELILKTAFFSQNWPKPCFWQTKWRLWWLLNTNVRYWHPKFWFILYYINIVCFAASFIGYVGMACMFAKMLNAILFARQNAIYAVVYVIVCFCKWHGSVSCLICNNNNNNI